MVAAGRGHHSRASKVFQPLQPLRYRGSYFPRDVRLTHQLLSLCTMRPCSFSLWETEQQQEMTLPLHRELGIGTARVTGNQQKLLNPVVQEPKNWGGAVSHPLWDGSASQGSTGSQVFNQCRIQATLLMCSR